MFREFVFLPLAAPNRSCDAESIPNGLDGPEGIDLSGLHSIDSFAEDS
jgi:hypothetical protein